MARSSLATYYKKRDFGKTAEPKGKVARTGRQASFVVHKHAASHLHFDLRLEIDGVYKSWAVPKGPSLDPADKRLAMMVEDHPLEYGKFEGTIPKGQYGGGTVQLFDRGAFVPEGDALAALRAGKLKFLVDGERMKGGWTLVRLRMRKDEDRPGHHWLLIKERDEQAKRGKAADIASLDESVATGRSMDEIAQGDPPRKSRKAKGATKAAKVSPAKGGGVTLSSPDKVLWPHPGVTKADLRDYYVAVADRLMPFLVDRPLSIIRAPDGIQHECFFQRHAMVGMSRLIDTVKVKGEPKPYLVIRSAEALPALAQIAALELHPWGSTTADTERPDMLTFDLDPDKGLSFTDLRKAAFDMRDYLGRLGLGAFLKLTGGKGLHVVVPIKPTLEWDEAKAFARALVEVMAADKPDAYTTNVRKVKRRGRVFLDYLRNGKTATAVAAWSPRARDGAPIAVPISWNFIHNKRAIPRFTLDKVDAAFKAADGWKDYDTARRPLPSLDALKKL